MATGIVVEYNPMHRGHLLHLRGAAAHGRPVIAVMSGWFVQRGEPAVAPPSWRANIAAQSGADLVVLLPVCHSIQSAQYFADGAVRLLAALHVKRLVFGSGVPMERLLTLQERLSDPKTQDRLREELRDGKSYAQSHARALSADWLDANARLGLAYMEAVRTHRFEIESFAVPRAPWPNSARPLLRQNATSLRKELFAGRETGDALVAPLAPPLPSLDAMTPVLQWLLQVSSTDPSAYPYFEPGLWDRLRRVHTPDQEMTEWIESARSKRHPKARIARFLTHMLLGLTTDERDEATANEPDAIVPLAMTARGRDWLRRLKTESDLPILSTKKALYRHVHKNPSSPLRWDLRAEALWHLCLQKTLP